VVGERILAPLDGGFFFDDRLLVRIGTVPEIFDRRPTITYLTTRRLLAHQSFDKLLRRPMISLW
jgi:hypothetical protein